MKRVVFVNLHSNVFYVKTLLNYIYGLSVATKHRYLLDYLLSDPNIEICNFVNDRGCSLVAHPTGLLLRFTNLVSGLEHEFIMKKNGLKGRIKLIKNVTEIKNDDIVIAYIHSPNSLRQLEDIHAKKIVCTIHMYGMKYESDLLRAANPDVLFNEYNLQQNSEIFKKNFSWFKGKFYAHPFAYAARFKNNVPFNERENLAFSVGTITYKESKEYSDFYGTTCLQPSRKQILENKDALGDYLVCYNSEYMEDFKPIHVSNRIPKILRLPITIYNMRHTGNQKKYFSFDMVEMFNKYKMFICGEEVSGTPAVGFVEGMACGAAFIGNKTIGCYEDYGMKEGVHYIGYDGTLDNLKKVISFYQREENQETLRTIAKNGMLFAKENFEPRKIAERLFGILLNS